MWACVFIAGSSDDRDHDWKGLGTRSNINQSRGERRWNTGAAKHFGVFGFYGMTSVGGGILRALSSSRGLRARASKTRTVVGWARARGRSPGRAVDEARGGGTPVFARTPPPPSPSSGGRANGRSGAFPVAAAAVQQQYYICIYSTVAVSEGWRDGGRVSGEGWLSGREVVAARRSPDAARRSQRRRNSCTRRGEPNEASYAY